jgi:AcrR family transcriptional regulator
VAGRRDELLDAAISLLGQHGVRGLTHRAVDAEAGVPAGSASNHFRTKDTLLDAVVERFAARERANWEDIAAQLCPTTPAELTEALAKLAHDATGAHRTLTLARYVILVEAAQRPRLRAQLTVTGGRVRAWFVHWMRVAGAADPERDTPIVQNHYTGLVLHQLAYPDPAFDPAAQLGPLIDALVRPGRGESRMTRPEVLR